MSDRSSSNYYRNKLFETYDRASICFHEAGHAICALAHYLYVDNISVPLQVRGDSYGFQGFTVYRSYLNDLSSLDKQTINGMVKLEVSIHYAGLTSEKILLSKISGKKSILRVLEWGSYKDIQEASKLISKHNLASPGKKRKAFKNKMMKYTRELLETHWDDISLIAHYLFSHNKINKYQIKKILLKQSNNVSYWKERFKVIEAQER